MYPATKLPGRTVAPFAGVLIFLFAVCIRGAEIPAAVWATYVTGTSAGVVAPKILANPAGGFYLYSAGDRPLIKLAADGAIVWEVPFERGVNEVREVTHLDILDNGDLIAIVTATSNARLFGQQFTKDGTFLVQLHSADASPVFVKACENCALTALKARTGGGYFLAGYSTGAARIGNDALPITDSKIFLTQFTSAFDWTLTGGGNLGPYEYPIQAIRTTGSGATLRVWAGGTAPASLTFAGKSIDQAGAFLITADASGQNVNAQIILPNSSFGALEIAPSGALHFAANSASQSVIRRIDSTGALGWTLTLTNTQIAALTRSDEPCAVGTSEFAVTMAIDSLGNIKWQRREANRAGNTGAGVALLGDGRLAISGVVAGSGVFVNDFFLRDYAENEIGLFGAFVAVLETRAGVAPVFRSQPADQKCVVRGESATVHADVYSDTPATFLWYKDGVAIASQISTDLRLASAQASDSGVYYLEARNSAGVTRSRSVEIRVNVATVSAVPGTEVSGLLETPRNPIVLPEGSIVVVDTTRHVIKRVTTNGVTTFAGGGQAGHLNGAASEALFSSPMALALETRYFGPSIYVADGGNHLARRISFSAQTGDAISVSDAGAPLAAVNAIATLDGLASFFAGSAQSGAVWEVTGDPVSELTGGAFANNTIAALALDAHGNVYIADGSMNEIHRRTPTGKFEHVAAVNGPSGIALDESGNLYVTERLTHTVRKISPTGATTLVSGGEGIFNAPEGLCFRGDSLIVADTGNHRLCEIKFEPAQTVITGTAKITATIGSFLRLGVSGNVGEKYAIESSAQITPGASWQNEGTVSIGQVTSELLLPKPTSVRFYRARKIQ